MSFADPIGDMISRIRNAQMRTLNTVEVPCSKFRTKILDVLNVNNSLSKRKSYGGTSPENVLSAIKRAKQRFLKD